MRTSSFSNAEVVSTVSQYFVPVWLSNDDYGQAKKPQAERDELTRIKQITTKKKLVNGDVNVFLVDPEGDVIDTLIVAKAMEPQNLLPLLKKVVTEKGLKNRDPASVTASAAPSVAVPASTQPGGILLHVFTRYLPPGEQGNTDDFVELTTEDYSSLVPRAEAKVGDVWDIAKAVTDKVFPFCFPAVCHYDAKASKIKDANLKATVTAVTSSEVQITLTGNLDMDHSRDGNIDGRVTAKLLGLVRYDTTKKSITSIQIASQDAEYVWHWQGKPSRYRIAFVIDSALPQLGAGRVEAKRAS